MEALLQKQREAMAEREAIEKEHETAVLKEKLRAQIAACLDSTREKTTGSPRRVGMWCSA